MTSALLTGVVGLALGQQYKEGQKVPPRLGKYREEFSIPISPFQQALSDEGSYFIACNATPGTAANYAIQTSFSDTVAMFSLRNAAGAGVNKRIYPHYIRVVQGSTVPASATSMQYAIKLDIGTRDSSGTLLTPISPNLDSGSPSIAVARYTPTMAAASNANRFVSRGVMRSVIPVAFDEWLFVFGDPGQSGIGSLGGTVAQRMTIPVPPIILGPEEGQAMTIHVWLPANAATAGQYEYELAWWER